MNRPPKYTDEFTVAREPSLSGKVTEIPIGEALHREFTNNGAEMVEAWQHKGLCCIIAGEPVGYNGPKKWWERLRDAERRSKHWHVSVSIKDDMRQYVRWPTQEEIQLIANTFFVPGLIFVVDPTVTGEKAIVNLWSKPRFNRYHRAGVAESEG